MAKITAHTTLEDMVKLAGKEVEFNDMLLKDLEKRNDIYDKLLEKYKKYNIQASLDQNLRKKIKNYDEDRSKLQNNIEARSIKQIDLEKKINGLNNANLIWIKKMIASNNANIVQRQNIAKIRIDKNIKKFEEESIRNIKLMTEENKKLLEIEKRIGGQTVINSINNVFGTEKWIERLKVVDGIFVRIGGSSASIINKIGTVGAIGLGILGKMLEASFSIFTEYETAYNKFRKDLGITRKTTGDIADNVMESVRGLRAMGVTYEIQFKSIKHIGDEIGSINLVTKDTADLVSLFNTQLGISQDITAKLLKTFASVSQTTLDSQKNIVGLTAELSNAAGTSLTDVMGDIEKASASAFHLLDKTPISLLKAAVEARRFGTSLSSLVSTSKSVLNFQSSIQDEMEASVLLGRSLNLQRLRELAWNRDNLGMNRELLRLMKDFNFDRMNPIQAESFARALGKTTEELGKIKQNQISIESIQKGNDNLAKEALNKYQKKLKMSDAELKLLGEKGIEDAKSIRNATRMEEIQDKLQSILNDSFSTLIPKIDAAFTSINYLLAPIKGLADAAKNLGNWLGMSPKWERTFLNIGKIVLSISAMFGSNLIAPVMLLYNWIDRFSTSLGDLIGNMKSNSIGEWVITLGKSIGRGLLDGLYSVGDTLVQVLWSPFKSAYDIIKDWWCGNSPSKLGLAIVDGILSIGGMLISAITEPFKKSWEYIKNITGQLGDWISSGLKTGGEYIVNKYKSITSTISNIGTDISDSITYGLKTSGDFIVNKYKAVSEKVKSFFSWIFGGENKNVEKEVTNNRPISFRRIPPAVVTTGTEMLGPELPKDLKNLDNIKNIMPTIKVDQSDTTALLSKVIDAINGLRTDMNSGKITSPLYIDGQLFTSYLDRSSKYYNGYGTNYAG